MGTTLLTRHEQQWRPAARRGHGEAHENHSAHVWHEQLWRPVACLGHTSVRGLHPCGRGQRKMSCCRISREWCWAHVGECVLVAWGPCVGVCVLVAWGVLVAVARLPWPWWPWSSQLARGQRARASTPRGAASGCEASRRRPPPLAMLADVGIVTGVRPPISCSM